MFHSRLLFLYVAIMVPGFLLAHAKMTATLPADGDFVPAPDSLVLEFDGPVRLTSLDIVEIDGRSRPLAELPAKPAASFRIELPGMLETGEYYVVWKATAADGHFSTGEFFFTVIGE